jgi:hypothetical protein
MGYQSMILPGHAGQTSRRASTVDQPIDDYDNEGFETTFA